MSTAARIERTFAAVDAVFDRTGLDGVTMDAIAAEAGMSKRTLYGLFCTRDHLLAAYMERTRCRFVRELSSRDQAAPLEQRLRRLLTPFPETRPSGLPVAMLRLALTGSDPGPHSPQECLTRWLRADRELIQAELDRAVARGEARIADTREAALLLESMVRPSILDVLLGPAPPDEATAQRRFEAGLAMFLAAVGA